MVTAKTRSTRRTTEDERRINGTTNDGEGARGITPHVPHRLAGAQGDMLGADADLQPGRHADHPAVLHGRAAERAPGVAVAGEPGPHPPARVARPLGTVPAEGREGQSQ